MKKSPGQTKTKKVVLKETTSNKPKTYRKYSSIRKTKIKKVLKKEKIDIRSLDWLRSIAILLMVFTHVTSIFYSFKNDNFIEYISLAGGTLCFTLFLFVSGGSTYISTDGFEKVKGSKIVRKSLNILLVYYLTATISLWAFNLGFPGEISIEWVREFVRLFFFQKIPPYTEYLLPFFIISISILFYKKIYKAISENLVILTLTSAIFYSIGFLIFSIDFGDRRLNILKAILGGHNDIHTFPVLQYVVIFFVGIYLGKLLLRRYLNNDIKALYDIRVVAAVLGGLTVSVAFIYEFVTPITFLNYSVYTGRFPPSVTFIGIGLFVSSLLLLFFEYLDSKKLLKNGVLSKYIEFVSRNSLGFFFWHLVLIFSIKSVFDENKTDLIDDPTIIVVLWALIVLLCVGLIIITNRIKKLFFKKDVSIQFALTSLFLLSILTVRYAIVRNNAYAEVENYEVVPEVTRDLSTNDSNWWDNEYYGKVEILVDKDNFLGSTNWIRVEINHSDFIEQGLSFFPDGKDLRIVKFDEGFTEIASGFENPDTTATSIFFKVDQDSSARYYLYFGNEFPAERVQFDDLNNIRNAEYTGISGLMLKEINLDLERKWNLRGFKDLRGDSLNFEVTSDMSELEMVEFKILNEQQEEILSGNLDDYNEIGKNYSIPIRELSVGTYFIELADIEINEDIQLIQSKRQRFFISYPIFVNWSMDWEGFGVNQEDLNDIADIVSKYGVKLTHYFNPRIYVTDQYTGNAVSRELAIYYTNWVINRRNTYREEIGLHIHLYPDLLNEVGIEPVSGAGIVGIGRDEHMLQSYSVEDLVEIFEWSIEKFEENNIGMPLAFRSGAWMSGPNVLEALEEVGILIDSSGRTAGVLNPSIGASSRIPWNLTATTKPYQPNIDDINSAAPPNFDLWEFPNNGADSYWFSAEEMISRFNQNYKTIMEEPQVVTYLSHPHQFKTFDSQKIRGLLGYIDQYDYSEDKGPAVYSTLEKVYYEYSLNLF